MAPAFPGEKEPASKLRTFTWQQLAEHNREGDAYIAVRDKVYDVTKWMYKHPGGRDALLVAAGRDCTQVFETYHKLETHQLLSKYLVGTLTTHELPTFPPMSEFHITMKKRVEGFFKAKNLDPKFSYFMVLRYLFIYLGIALGLYGQIVLAENYFILALVSSIFLGWCGALIGLMPMHDGSHFCFSHNPTLWNIVGSTHDFFNGASYLVWLYQHMLGHHAYTNVEGADPDIVTSENDFRRIKESQPWFYKYVYQHMYVPVLYAFLAWKTRYQDIAILCFIKKNGDIRINPPTNEQWAIFWGGKAFFVLHRIILPLMFVPLGKFAILFTAADMMSSYWLAILFQANHIALEVQWPVPDENNFINRDWAEMQVITTQDYAHDSWFWTVFSGGLNYQVTHHLFPGVSQFYYPVVGPIIRKTCDEYKVPYIVQPTAYAAIQSHVNFLNKMGEGSAPNKSKKMK